MSEILRQNCTYWQLQKSVAAKGHDVMMLWSQPSAGKKKG